MGSGASRVLRVRRLLRPLMGPLAAILVVLTLALFGAGSGLAAKLSNTALPASLQPVTMSWWFRLTPLYGQVFAVVGAFIVWRRPGNRVGWVALGIGLLWAVYQFATDYDAFAGSWTRTTLPAAGFASFLVNWEWILPTVLMIFTLPFLFPDGRPVSPSWATARWGVRGLVLAGMLGSLVLPAATSLPAGVTGAFETVLHVALVACVVVAAASLAVRYRRSDLEVRAQLKWFAGAYAVLAVIAVVGFVVTVVLEHSVALSFAPVFDVLIPIGMIGIALSVAIAIFKYHLYDIDVVIRRTLVYGTLVGLIGLLYLVLVVTIGTRLGTNLESDPAIPFVVAAVVALAFLPVRTRLTRLANRLVYGKRATPYEVLSSFGEQVSSIYSGDDLTQRMARLLAEGTEADRAEVWLHVGDELRPAAAWPVSAAPALPLAICDAEVPIIPGAAGQMSVRFQGETLGVLAVVKREAMTGTEHRLLNDLARQASVVLKNARLTAELEARLRELQASRQRLVSAQDEERRRLERDLHDGAQQNLVALKIQLGLARTLAMQDPSSVGPVLERLTEDADEAIQVLRRFSHGIYPPILAERGLQAALEAHVRLLPLPVQVGIATPLPRLERQVESAVYFCALEALQNVVKHAHATHAEVRLWFAQERLCFAVVDDGTGIDAQRLRQGAGMTNMADRLAALGGELEVVRGEGGAGASVGGWVPASTPR